MATLAGSDRCTQAAVDHGRLRKHGGRKKLKADDETDVDGKNRKITGNDDDDDGADADDAEDNDGHDHSNDKLNRLCLSNVRSASLSASLSFML